MSLVSQPLAAGCPLGRRHALFVKDKCQEKGTHWEPLSRKDSEQVGAGCTLQVKGSEWSTKAIPHGGDVRGQIHSPPLVS